MKVVALILILLTMLHASHAAGGSGKKPASRRISGEGTEETMDMDVEESEEAAAAAVGPTAGVPIAAGLPVSSDEEEDGVVLVAGPSMEDGQYGPDYFFDPSLPSFAVPSGMTFEQAWSVFAPYFRRTFSRNDRGETNRFLGVLEHIVSRDVYHKICERCLEWVIDMRLKDADGRRRQASVNEWEYLKNHFLGRNGITGDVLKAMWDVMEGPQRTHMEEKISEGEQEFRRRSRNGFDRAWEAARNAGMGAVAEVVRRQVQGSAQKKKKKPRRSSTSRSNRKRKRNSEGSRGMDDEENEEDQEEGSSGARALTEDEPMERAQKRRKDDDDEEDNDGGGKPAAVPRGLA